MCSSRMARDGQGVCHKQATQEFGCGGTLRVSGKDRPRVEELNLPQLIAREVRVASS